MVYLTEIATYCGFITYQNSSTLIQYNCFYGYKTKLTWCIYPIYTLSYLTGLDYKKLTDEDLDPLKALEPVLSSQNVLSISKLASRIPKKGSGALTASAVHATWLPKLFWQGDSHLLKKSPQSDQDFLHAYDTCAKYLDRLMPLDAIYFLDSITFSLEAANQVSTIGAIVEVSVCLLFVDPFP